MGFQIGRTFKLDFGKDGETDAAGADIVMRSASVGILRELNSCTAEREDEILVEHLVSWNLEDGGVPLPLTVESITLLEGPFRTLIVVEWLRATRGISAPFDRRSDDGGPSPAAESAEPWIPMENLSDSP